MRMILALFAILAALLVVAYAHLRLARQVASPLQRWIGHGLLILVASGFGWAMSSVYMDTAEGGTVTVFLTAFGVAHLPPAVVLWLKGARDRQTHG